MQTLYIKIEGMTCRHCRAVIRSALLKVDAVQEVSFNGSIAIIRCKESINRNALSQSICEAGYVTKPEWISNSRRSLGEHIRIVEFALILFALLLISQLLEHLLGFNLFGMIPTIDSSITLGMLTLTGLMTSIHCISMCGAINLSVASGKHATNRLAPLLYNSGRVLSYTIIGGIVGATGSVFDFSDKLTGCVILLAGTTMLLMALNALGFLQFHLPVFFRIRARTSNAFLIGALNGLMPCGPLQAMQLYALSIGSWKLGALSMFLFGLGTVPAMLLVSMLAGYLNGRRRALVNKISGVLILLLSIAMVNRGLLALGIDLSHRSVNRADYLAAALYDGYQQVEFDLDYNNYADIVVQKGVPVRMIIHADQSHLTGCNNAVESSKLGFSSDLQVGENIIEFTPTAEGSYPYTCWMDMIRNTILVIDDPDSFIGGNP